MVSSGGLSADSTQRMPVLFAGHGSPLNAIEDNRWSRGFSALSEMIPKPAAILAVSAHWYVEGTFLTANERPETIHDFSGFPPELYEIDYSAPGAPALAERVRDLIGEDLASLSKDWGLDHGTWSVLKWIYPQADVPVIQLSIDRRLSPAAHYELGRSLISLRDEGVLIIGSGNVVHNLRDAFGRMQSGSDETPAWASSFDEKVAGMLKGRDTEALLSAWPDSEHGPMSHPTPDHWLPLIYAYAATDEIDEVHFPVEGFDHGSLSMRCAVFGR